MENLSDIKRNSIGFFLLVVFFATGSLWAVDCSNLSKQEVKSLIGNVKTAQDHECLATHFDAEAEQLEAEAKDHVELAAQYKANPTMQESKSPMGGKTAGHCEYFAEAAKKAAKEDRELAADHREMAKQAQK